MKKVLCLDGGGTRGIILCNVLDYIEQKTGKQIHELFDLIGGPSVGGLVAAGITCPDPTQPSPAKPRSAKDLQDLFIKESSKIFSTSFFHRIKTLFGLTGLLFDGIGMKEVLTETFGNIKLSEVPSNLMLPSYDVDTNNINFFKNFQAKQDDTKDFFMKDVVSSIISIPAVFSPSRIKDIAQTREYHLIDGGVITYSFNIALLSEAKKLFPGEEILLVSIGTGQPIINAPYYKSRKWGIIRWLFPIMKIIFYSNTSITDYYLKLHMLPLSIGKPSYYRLQTVTLSNEESFSLYDSGEAVLLGLVARSDAFIKANSQKIDELCEILKL
jgi:patatin-like phospholipase/acyl hydrolase